MGAKYVISELVAPCVDAALMRLGNVAYVLRDAQRLRHQGDRQWYLGVLTAGKGMADELDRARTLVQVGRDEIAAGYKARSATPEI